MSNAVADVQVAKAGSVGLSLIDSVDVNQVRMTMQKIATFQAMIRESLKEGQDYGVIPGCDKPSLLKPGAEKILMLMGITSQYEIIEKVEDHDTGFYSYAVKCILKKHGMVITEGFGSCNTREKKYITQDGHSIANTCLKMAKKRAQIDASLTVGSLSDIFTQDIEDMDLSTESAQSKQTGGPGDVKITFGTHKGKTIKEVPRDYVEWLANNAKSKSIQQAAAAFLAQSAEQPKGDESATANEQTAPEPKMATEAQAKTLTSMLIELGEIQEDSDFPTWCAATLNRPFEKVPYKKAEELIDRAKSKLDTKKIEDEFDLDNLPF